MSEHVTLDIQDNIATLTLNRPEARNALSTEMQEGLAEYLTQVDMDSNVRCVVLKGEGGHFMAGGDIKGFRERQNLSQEEKRGHLFRKIHDLHYVVYRMRKMPKPIIAGVQGAAAGAGVSLVAACDMAIAADSAFFTLAYAMIGLSPDASSTFFLPRIMGMKKAFEMMYLAERLDAQTAKEFGLINRVVPEAELNKAVDEMAKRLAAGPTFAYGRGKALLNSSLNETLESQLEKEAFAIADCMASEDFDEGTKAFVEKRLPQFKGK